MPHCPCARGDVFGTYILPRAVGGSGGRPRRETGDERRRGSWLPRCHAWGELDGMACGTGNGIPAASAAVSGQSLGGSRGSPRFICRLPIGGEPPEGAIGFLTELAIPRRQRHPPNFRLANFRLANFRLANFRLANFRQAGPDSDGPTLLPRKRKSNVNNVLSDSGKG
jgi:hypothetical protein